jgi:hypothetical protein
MEQEIEIKKFIENKEQSENKAEKETTETTVQEQKEEKQPTVNVVIKQDDESVVKDISDIKELPLSGKIEKLFKLAETKNLIYAINLARKTGDAYLIDVFRDQLAENGYYKKFLK